jgi:DNA replication protein DnaC
MYSRENYRLAKEEIERRRISAVAIADARNEELRASYPDINEIDKELTGTGLLLFKTACEGGDVDAIRVRNRELVKKRRALLVSYGFPENYTDVQYTCPICQDTGFVDTKMCRCLKELLILKNVESSGMGKLIERQSFDNFDLEWYSDDEENYKRMKNNLTIARGYADNFPARGGNLLLIGNTGTGKTHVSTAIAKTVISQGFEVLYDSSQNIVNEFENDRFRSGYGQHESASRKYMECDLLIIDDLGTEFVNSFTVSCLYNLLNTRQNRGLSTIISTNLSAEELAGKYEGRIYSRIIGCDYRVLFFKGRDHRVYR